MKEDIETEKISELKNVRPFEKENKLSSIRFFKLTLHCFYILQKQAFLKYICTITLCDKKQKAFS